MMKCQKSMQIRLYDENRKWIVEKSNQSFFIRASVRLYFNAVSVVYCTLACFEQRATGWLVDPHIAQPSLELCLFILCERHGSTMSNVSSSLAKKVIKEKIILIFIFIQMTLFYISKETVNY